MPGAVIHKQEKRLPAAVYTSVPWKCAKWILSHAQLNVFCQTFLVQRWRYCWATIKAFYGIPHIISISILVLGSLMPLPRKYKDEQRRKKAHEEHQSADMQKAVSEGDRTLSSHILPEEEERKKQ